MDILISGDTFRDEHGRRLMLRGVNLGGSSKVPFSPDGSSYRREGFFNHREVSFTGRPFPLDEADEHFSRLKSWGLDFLRFLVTWEAIEHAGPGIYDQDYLQYVRKILEKAAEYEINVFIDPHQDVWSRFSGGDGAPGWTFEAVGMDMTGFQDTGAAIVHNTHGDPFPRMIWATNYQKLAAATMFTLFFGGNDFAPDTTVNGIPVQEYLQSHYINAVRQVALQVKDLSNVIGYDVMNELSAGYIDWPHAGKLKGMNRKGFCPTPFQAMALGEGYPMRVSKWQTGYTGIRYRGNRQINPQGRRAWLDGSNCIWREHGVWDIDAAGQPQLIKPEYFAVLGEGRPVNFPRDYLKPFILRFASEIRQAHPRSLIFVEHEVDGPPPSFAPGELEGMVYAHHWYDLICLVLKNYTRGLLMDTDRDKVVAGFNAVEKSVTDQFARIKARGRNYFCGAPALIGETGIPYDMKKKKAFRTGRFAPQTAAMDRTVRGLEANLLSYTLWNYTADNTNERGDRWNDEDLSIFSRDQQSDPADINSGGRALSAVVRPYPRKVAGDLLNALYDMKKGIFTCVFRHDPAVEAPTEIYVPSYRYPDDYQVEISDGEYRKEPQKQLLIYRHSRDKEIHRITVLL